MEKYKRYIFIGMIIISLGITTATTSRERFGSLGIVFIGLGALFFIAGMNMKRKYDEDNK